MTGPQLSDICQGDIPGRCAHLSSHSAFQIGGRSAREGGHSAAADRSPGLLFPLVRIWPTASPTAESLLIRRKGNKRQYLSELRHPGDSEAPDGGSGIRAASASPQGHKTVQENRLPWCACARRDQSHPRHAVVHCRPGGQERGVFPDLPAHMADGLHRGRSNPAGGRRPGFLLEPSDPGDSISGCSKRNIRKPNSPSVTST